VNTVDIEASEEELGDPRGAAEWLTRRGLLRKRLRITDRDLELLLRVREAIRELAFANQSGGRAAGTIATLNEIARTLPLSVRFEGSGRGHLEPGSRGVKGALARILGIVYTSMADGTWPRLKACRRDTCRWLFYDHSKNRSSRWCHMSICGNRHKARTYRARHHRASAS
jgi:predicted RNA-binding Zn ribbon-like protein